METVNEMRAMGDAELVEKLAQTRQELFNLRFQHVTGQLDNSSRLGHLRKDVARISTLLRQREIEAADAQFPEEGRRGRR